MVNIVSLPLLHAISYYSLMYGVNAPEQIVRAAKAAGYQAICIADRNNLYALPLSIAAGKKYGVTVFVGVELTLSEGTMLVFADGDTGYRNVCSIISRRMEATVPDVAFVLRGSLEDICVTTDSKVLFEYLHGRCRCYYRMARPRRVPTWVRQSGSGVLVVPPAAFIDTCEYAQHRLLAAINSTTIISDVDPADLLENDSVLQPVSQLVERFEVFASALETTAQFARTLRPCQSLQRLKMPHVRGNRDAEKLLRKKTLSSAEKRYGTLDERVMERINFELDLIAKKGFSDYFLIVDDIVKQSPRTCGRGSGAASVVAYVLGITNVDPISNNLMFERFLNEGRTDPPDIDIDFAWDERDDVLAYVFSTYGCDHAAMVATHQTFGVRMAIREVARVYGMTEQEIGAVTKKIPWIIGTSEDTADLASLLQAWPAFEGKHFDASWKKILSEAGEIIGLPRAIGTHPGGVVITDAAITTHVPVQKSAKGYPVMQWEKEGAEAMGLVKIDLLGNRSLAVIRDTIASLQRAGIRFDEQRWLPQDDRETQRLLAAGKTMGVFYVESPAMRLLQRKSGKGDFEHLVIHSSIIRPAANKFIRLYLDRLHGASWSPLHPCLKGVLDETFGIMVYQEDVSKVAVALASFSAADADRLRKIVAKKSGGETFDVWKQRFFDGAAANGVSRDTVKQAWEMMESFSGYSFCKPHSASYVQVSFQAAYLKAHYPAHFMAAVLSNYGGFYTTQAYVSEAMRLGITILPPGVNSCASEYRAMENTIYVGLCQIAGLSHTARDTVVAKRQQDGNYTSLHGLLERTGLNEHDAEKLVVAGACDEIDSRMSRPEQFWVLRTWFRSESAGSVPRLGRLSRETYLLQQYTTLGFLTSCHPITLTGGARHRPALRGVDLAGHVGEKIALYGWCVTSKTVTAKTGHSMEFVTFEDETATFETVFFPVEYKRYSHLISLQVGFLLQGKVTEEFGVAIIEVQFVSRVQ